jgi:molecular chaperone HtpG
LLVGHAIYNDPTVAIRELLQNSIDAVRFQHHLDDKKSESDGKTVPSMGKVSVSWNPETRQLVVEDTGTGMDLDIIKFHLMRVGASYYDTSQFAIEHKGFTPISRFGIGILTCFMISDDIEIITFRQKCGHRIKMTSVHADYLLRELAPGDPSVASIEPHGTRVTLIVREGVDFSKRPVEEILQYWVVLPSCQVDYQEPGKEALRIGFASPKEALEYYLHQEAKELAMDSWKPEVISKRCVVDGGSYEIAMAVESGWFPEKSFAWLLRKKLPAVCLEGICVSESFPGFSFDPEGRRFAALVSVRGVRGLRTTVSRYGLEEDEFSFMLGKVCSEMMFDHVRDEVERIAKAKGRPLSRASTAGKWLSSDLLRMVGPKLHDHVVTLRAKLATLVLEVTTAPNEMPKSERRLVSATELRELPHFWTIESRLVDSLGIISRDLGRELSLNEFLHALAPDLEELRYSPIVPDAHLFSDDVLASHHPALAQFSRRHQQTAIKWIPRIQASARADRESLLDDAFKKQLRAQIEKLGEEEEWSPNLTSSRVDLLPAELAGDDSNIQVVHTRVVSVVMKDSQPAKVQELLKQARIWALEKRDTLLFAHVLCLNNIFMAGLLDRVSPESMYYQYGGSDLDTFVHISGSKRREREGRDTRARRLWVKIAWECNESIRRTGGDIVLPEEPCDVTADMIFDASTYWRDWHRTKEQFR